MEVPCCSGLVRLAESAVRLSGKDITLHDVTVTLRGQIIEDAQGAAHHAEPALSAERKED